MNDKTETNSIPFEPARELIIKDLDTLRIITDPLRLRLVELLVHEQATVKQLALRLDTTVTRLYHHISLLEEHGLIQVVSTRIVSGIIEKQYRATAHKFPIDKSLLSFVSNSNDDSLGQIIAAHFDNTKAEIIEAVKRGVIDLTQTPPQTHRLLLMRGVSHLKPEQADDFYQRLSQLIEEFVPQAEIAPPDHELYGLTIAFYPTFPQHSGDSPAENQPENE